MCCSCVWEPVSQSDCVRWSFYVDSTSSLFYYISCWNVFLAEDWGETMSVWTEKPAAQDKSVVLCRSDGAQSDNRSFAHQIKEMSHTSTHKTTLQDQTTVMWSQKVSLLSYEKKINTEFKNSSSHSAWITASATGNKSQEAPAVDWQCLCDMILGPRLCRLPLLCCCSYFLWQPI